MKRTAILGILAVLALAASAQAATITTWTSITGGTFSDSANWDPNGVPTSSVQAKFTSGTYTVSFTGNQASNGIVIDGGDITFDLASHTYDVQNVANAINIQSGTLKVEGAGTLRAGTSTTNNTSINLASSSSTMEVGGGAIVDVVKITNGTASGGGSLVVDGSGSTLSATRRQSVNYGTITVQNGGAINLYGLLAYGTSEIKVGAGSTVSISSPSGYIRFYANSSKITLMGGSFTAPTIGYLSVGGTIRGTGTITITSGGEGLKNNNGGQLSPGDIADSTPVIGTLNVAGGNLTQYAGATTYFDFNAAGSGSADLINLTGGTGIADLQSGSTLTFNNLGGALVEGTWNFVKAKSITNNATWTSLSDLLEDLAPEAVYDFGVVDGAGDDAGYKLLQLKVTSIPEPGALALLVIGGIGMMLRRRRA